MFNFFLSCTDICIVWLLNFDALASNFDPHACCENHIILNCFSY